MELGRRTTMEITGTINNGTVVFDKPCPIPDGTKVSVRIDSMENGKSEAGASSLGKRLLKHAGTVAGLPEDLAEQHDTGR
jgi:hypothetical protein